MVKQIMRRAMVWLIPGLPAMAGLAAVAEPLIELLLTDKWLIAVPFLQIFCATYAFWPVHTANLQAINALGRSDIFLKTEIVKKAFGVSVLAVTIPIGIYAMALGTVLTGIIGTFVNAYPNKLLLNYSFAEQWRSHAGSHTFINYVWSRLQYPVPESADSGDAHSADRGWNRSLCRACVVVRVGVFNVHNGDSTGVPP